MEWKRVLKLAAGCVAFLAVCLYVHEAYAVFVYYQKMDAYMGKEALKEQEMYPDYENFSWGKIKQVTGCGAIDSMLRPYEFSKKELFEQKNERIIYGKVNKVHQIVCEAGNVTMPPGIQLSENLEGLREELAEKPVPGKKRKYSAYLAEIRVFRSISGGLEDGRKYWVFVGTKLTADSLKKGDTGIFVIFHNPTFVFLKDSVELIPTVGNITGFGVCKLSYLLDREAEGLKELKTKTDVIRYWEEHGLLREAGDGRDQEIKLEGQRIFPAECTYEEEVFEEGEVFRKDVREYLSQADTIFDGEIRDIKYYFTRFGAPETEYTVYVNESYAGRAKKGQTVKVRMDGGFVYYKDFNNYFRKEAEQLRKAGALGDDLVEVDYQNEKNSALGYSKVGERTVFVVEELFGFDYQMPDGAIAKIRFDNEKKVFVVRTSIKNPEKVILYTEKQWQKQLKEILRMQIDNP